MKTLYLLRHAKSSWHYPQLSDFERPLNDRGKKDAPRMGRWLKEQKILPDRVVSSPSVRTLATASRLLHELQLKGERIETDPSLFHATPSGMLNLIRSCPPEAHSLLLVGHNPGLTELAGLLCPAEAVDNIPTCGIYAIQFQTTDWAAAASQNAEFLFFQYPKNL